MSASDGPTADPAFVRRSEEAFLASWPSVATVLDGAWLIRLSPGWPTNGRANAVTILDRADGARAEARLDAAAALYARYDQPLAVRVTPLTPPAVVEVLDDRGLAPRKASLALSGPLPDDAAGAAEGLILEEAAPGAPSQAWLDTVQGTAEPGRREAFAAMMRACPRPTLFARIARNGRALAALSATVHHGLAVIENVVTHPEARRQGLARALLGHAGAWARVRGADRLFLFVEADNAPARAFYAAAGLAETHRYHYRGPVPGVMQGALS
ncbi:MAG: GNAT family N-acetyltransferase [Pseudomonadota bacterium]